MASPEHTLRVADNYGQGMLLESFAVPMDKHLRTEAEKENPTVPKKHSLCDGLCWCRHNVSALSVKVLGKNCESNYDALKVTTKSAPPASLQKPKDRCICTSHRTHNRIRSPRLATFGPQKKASNTCRHNSSVISGKGLALRIGFRVPILRFELF